MEIPNDKLLSCPFCGLTKVTSKTCSTSTSPDDAWKGLRPVLLDDSYITGEWLVYCQNCGVLVKTGAATAGAAVVGWNTRNGKEHPDCGRSADIRGWDRVWRFTKNGSRHCICPSCAE